VSCTEPRDLVHAYLDRELDLAKSLEMEQHFRECAICSEAYEEGRRLRTALNEREVYFSAPLDLHKRIRAVVRDEVRGSAHPRLLKWRAMAFAVPVALAAVIGLSIVPLLRRPITSDLLVDEIVSGHVRSLMVDHLVDVESTDQHTVRPWFNGKIDYAPPVTDFAASGFALVGGRMDYVAGRPVAVLVYRHQAHLVNLFIWPDRAGASGTTTSTVDGYSLVHWNDGDLTYWAVSDLNLHDLIGLADLVRQSPPHVTPTRE
jgi:anti-sigma factor RsiW